MGQFFHGTVLLELGSPAHRLTALALVMPVLAALLPGCQMVTPGKLTAAQSQNRILTEQNQAQLQEIENLKAHNRTVENQLIQAEEELAEFDQRLGVDRKQIANFHECLQLILITICLLPQHA